ncbi:MAG: sulfatase-like hydrolase/transferase [Verrucomicrobiota bacterium]
MRVFFLLPLFWISASAREATDRPNVIIIFFDDSGYGDYSHTGNPTIETPAISRLAAKGVNFTQFYVPSPACTASRYSLQTGRYPIHAGFPGYVINPDSREHLRTEETTIAEGLKTRDRCPPARETRCRKLRASQPLLTALGFG